MLVRKLPVKLAPETMQADELNRAGQMQAKSRSVWMCVSYRSIHPSIHLFTVYMSVCDFEQPPRVDPAYSQRRPKEKTRPVLLMKEPPTPVSGMSFLQQS